MGVDDHKVATRDDILLIHPVLCSYWLHGGLPRATTSKRDRGELADDESVSLAARKSGARLCLKKGEKSKSGHSRDG